MSALIVRAAFAVTLSIVVSGAAHAAGDPAAGKAVFQSTCGICHGVQPGQNKIGPTLFGLFGPEDRVNARLYVFAANLAANLTWDTATLDKYLEAPRAMIPGTKMTYAGLKDPQKRADLIAYLATLK